MTKDSSVVPIEGVEKRILLIRGQKVMLDTDLAELYGVTTKRLNEQVNRNVERFPEDFAFQLTEKEFRNLRSQFATSSSWGGRRHLPFAFTEHGAIMAASVLNSPRAVEMSIYVVRAFVRLRQMLAAHADLARKLDQLERKLATHDEEIILIVKALRELAAPQLPSKRRRIGFEVENK